MITAVAAPSFFLVLSGMHWCLIDLYCLELWGLQSKRLVGTKKTRGLPDACLHAMINATCTEDDVRHPTQATAQLPLVLRRFGAQLAYRRLRRCLGCGPLQPVLLLLGLLAVSQHVVDVLGEGP